MLDAYIYTGTDEELIDRILETEPAMAAIFDRLLASEAEIALNGEPILPIIHDMPGGNEVNVEVVGEHPQVIQEEEEEDTEVEATSSSPSSSSSS